MSIVWRSSNVLLLDHQVANRGVLTDKGENSQYAAQLKDDLFCIQECYLQPCQIAGKGSMKRKRKSADCDANEAEQASINRHEEVLKHLHHDMLLLSSAADVVEYFSRRSDIARHREDMGADVIRNFGVGDQLKQLSALASQYLPSQSSVDTAEDYSEEHECLVVEGSDDHTVAMRSCLFNTCVEHRCQQACIVDIDLGRFVLPPRSSFLMSDVSSVRTLLSRDVKYDIIVMDPPWENKSASRSHRYSTLPVGDIGKLPVSQLSAPHALIIIWITNKPKLIETVIRTLLPKWKLHFVTEWHWLKVTSSGEPVIPFASTHKRSYETLLICRRCCTDDVRSCLKPCCTPPTSTAPRYDESAESCRSDALLNPPKRPRRAGRRYGSRRPESSSDALDRSEEGNREPSLSVHTECCGYLCTSSSSSVDTGVPGSTLPAARLGTKSLATAVPSSAVPSAVPSSAVLSSAVPSVCAGYCTRSDAASLPGGRAATASGVPINLPGRNEVRALPALRGATDASLASNTDEVGLLSADGNPPDSVCQSNTRPFSESHDSKFPQADAETGATIAANRSDVAEQALLPSHLTLVSVPSKVHSHKPPLSDVLRPYACDSPRCLELFARSLTPGWMSWGNEVLSLQHTDYYQHITQRCHR